MVACRDELVVLYTRGRSIIRKGYAQPRAIAIAAEIKVAPRVVSALRFVEEHVAWALLRRRRSVGIGRKRRTEPCAPVCSVETNFMQLELAAEWSPHG